jgi:hypothetical protein
VLVSAACLTLFSIRPPQEITFTIETHGIKIGSDEYDWKSIRGFTIKKQKPNEPYAKLLVMTSRYFLPVFAIPLPPELMTEVRESLLRVIPALEIQESPSMLFMEKMGF